MTKRVIFILRLIVILVFIYGYVKTGRKNQEEVVWQNDKGMSVDEFKLKTSGKLVLVYFHADWCVPCIKEKPILDLIESEKKLEFTMLRLDVDDNPSVSTYFEINSLPQFMIYKNGKNVLTHSGFLNKQEIELQIESYK